MDDRNGAIFDHHEELFSQLSSVTEQELRDLVALDPAALLSMTGSAVRGPTMPPTTLAPVDIWGQRTSNPLAHFPLLADNGPGMLNSILPPVSMFNCSQALPYGNQLGSQHVGAGPNLYLDDAEHSLEAIKRSLMSLPDKGGPHPLVNLIDPPQQQQNPASLINMHRISTDKSTQDYLDSLMRPVDPESAELYDKMVHNFEPKLMNDHNAWNGLTGSLDSYSNFQSVIMNKSTSDPGSLLNTTDKNGNCPMVFNNGLPDKNKFLVQSNSMDSINRDIHNNLIMKSSSPSVSAESGIHTAATSYDSASPLSSGRTPLLSDDSISPLTSCASPVTSVRTPVSPLPRTPVRTDDCFSPGRVRRPDSSPMVRTRYDEAPSPRAVSRTPVRVDDAPSPRSIARTPLRNDDALSPRSVSRTPYRPDEIPSPRALSRTPLRTDEAPSPRGVGRSSFRNDDERVINRTPLRTDEAPSPRAVNRTVFRAEDDPNLRVISRTPLRTDETSSPRPVVRTPLRSDEAPSPRSISRTPARIDEAPSPRSVSRTFARMDEAPSPRAVVRTPLRSDEAPSPRAVSRTPVRADDDLSPRQIARTVVRDELPVRTPEAPSPRSQPSRTPVRSDGSVLRCVRNDEVTAQSPYSRTESSPLPSRTDASPRAKGAPFSPEMSPQSVRTPISPLIPATSPQVVPQKVPTPSPKNDPTAGRETETATPSEPPRRDEVEPDLLAGPEPKCPASHSSERTSIIDGPASAKSVSDVNVPEKNDSKPRKRRKTESMCVPSPKKRSKKKHGVGAGGAMPIYQSSVSAEESGIKLKLKLTAVKPAKPRKRRTTDESKEKGKRRKRSTPSPGDQSPWGRDMPPEVLSKIFKLVVDEEGCVPSLVRYSWVCRLWNSVATQSELWQNVDLSSPCIKQKCKIDRYFRWLLENRLGNLRNLNLNGWKFSNLPMVLSLIGTHCSEVESIGLSGWQGLHYEHLRSLLEDCPRLARIDLSDVSPESKSTNSAVSPKSITYLTEKMADRLTELSLAHNTLSCLPQIISSLAVHCPSLQVLDLSNIRRASHAEFALHIEELQEGCPLLRVLRITNSCITLAAVPFDQQAASRGFPALEELSIAGHQGTESLRITSVMDDDCLARIVKNSQKLRLLDVRGCTKITDASLVRVPAWDIQHLFLSGCIVTRQSNSGLELIAQKWSHSLVEIDLGWASVAEDVNAAVLALAERGDESPLRVVNLCGSAVEPEPVRTLITRCPQLESLNLQSCRGLPRGMKRLYEREQLPELQEMLQQNADEARDA